MSMGVTHIPETLLPLPETATEDGTEIAHETAAVHGGMGHVTREVGEVTVTVTVAISTSTVFMPSPITVPGGDCKCAATVAPGIQRNTSWSCDAVTLYTTQTVSHCDLVGAEG
ncbi:hypothetical protein F4808DRAFT_458858 [Astrocystis sublimbata]|nr:hypothetical protein F4808DRAFT_458858 [Astrocystis sublimbata]